MLVWSSTLDVRICSYSEGHIDANIKGKSGNWRFTGFYGHPETEKRHFSWELLDRLNDVSTGPCIVGGDFNEITSVHEKKGGAVRNHRQMGLFQDALNICKLMDAGFVGDKFTWKRGNNRKNQVKERLDRFCINHEMNILAPVIQIRHLGFVGSDHRALIAEWKDGTTLSNLQWGRSNQRFEEGWIKFKEAKKIVAESWVGSCRNGTQSFNAKILRCINNLHKWNKIRLKGGIKKSIAAKEDDIQRLYAEMDDSLWEEIIKAEFDLEELLLEEEESGESGREKTGLVVEIGTRNGSIQRLRKEGNRI